MLVGEQDQVLEFCGKLIFLRKAKLKCFAPKCRKGSKIALWCALKKSSQAPRSVGCFFFPLCRGGDQGNLTAAVAKGSAHRRFGCGV